MVRNEVRKATINSVGRICDISQFDTWFAYTMFLCRVLAVWVNTTSGIHVLMRGIHM